MERKRRVKRKDTGAMACKNNTICKEGNKEEPGQ